ncbi:hypothetical protein J21TS3_48140 [Paenibacillus cookii]|uniref:HTH cro/C1-type domain-containing protein n=1 Tax=Paenibacillus cookii TaxID=157839 RepID=A0ABQ4M4A3_9BACL|nr:hypothetical protein J21TS3_48140 [Paenibacillus cookii]
MKGERVSCEEVQGIESGSFVKNRSNQHEFSNMIGISQATLSELEQGKYNPSLEIGNITRELTAA